MDADPGLADQRQPDQAAQSPRPRRRLPFIVLGLLVVGMAATAGIYWLQTRNWETTEDAQVAASISTIAPQIAGRVVAIAVKDNQLVKAGQMLVRLDPRDQQVKLDQAQAQQLSATAQLAQARATLVVRQASVAQGEADMRLAEADLTQAEQNAARYRAVNPQAVSRQQVDNANAALRGMQARLAAARQGLAGAQGQTQVAAAQIKAAQAALRTADVAVEDARLQLSYTNIVAPLAGRVTRKTVEIGDYVKAGASLLSIVPPDRWISANFKETQLGAMKAGQSVRISLDAVPDVVFQGRVQSFQAGTGAVFSLLPAENATGNWVKVLQRLPVKILFDDSRLGRYRLAPGMSATVSVKVR